MVNDLLTKLQEYIKAHRLLTARDRVLVAVSGGPDSMALFHLFFQLYPKKIGVFHLNHNLRRQSDEEAAFVSRIAKQYAIANHIYNYDVMQYAEETNQSVETAARIVRYRLLDDCMEKHGYTKAAFGHHKDDQLETILMHFIRGSGLTGLAGMWPQRGRYIRPLLKISKQELIDYCRTFDIPYCQDQSNYSLDHVRNKYRLQLIPLIEKEYNPQFKNRMSQLAEIIRADDLQLNHQAHDLVKRLTRENDGVLCLRRDEFCKQSLSMQRRILQICLATARKMEQWLSFEHIESLRQEILKDRNFTRDLPQITVTGTAKDILFGQTVKKSLETGNLPVPGRVGVGDYCISLEILPVEKINGFDDHSEYFDFNKLTLPLIYRSRKPGDKIVVFGQHSPKKIKDLFIDAKIPQHLRDKFPIICDQEEIIMVCGLRRSEKGRISPDTQRVLRISVNMPKDCHSN